MRKKIKVSQVKVVCFTEVMMVQVIKLLCSNRSPKHLFIWKSGFDNNLTKNKTCLKGWLIYLLATTTNKNSLSSMNVSRDLNGIQRENHQGIDDEIVRPCDRGQFQQVEEEPRNICGGVLVKWVIISHIHSKIIPLWWSRAQQVEGSRLESVLWLHGSDLRQISSFQTFLVMKWLVWCTADD